MPKVRSLRQRSVYRKASDKANVSIALSNCFDGTAVTNSLNVANNSFLNSVASTSDAKFNDTYNLPPNSSISEHELSNTSDVEMFNEVVTINTFSNTSDVEIFNEVVSTNLSMFEENSLDGNNDISNNIYTDKTHNNNVVLKIKEWAIKHNITHSALNDLLAIVRPEYPKLPLDVRTLLTTPKQINIKHIEPGIYYHFGLRHCIKNLLLRTHNCLTSNCVELLINIDGLPIAKSNSSQLYPILCNIFTTHTVDIVGIYHGHAKPNDANIFLKDLVDDINNLISSGIYFNTKLYSIKIKGFICDAPAKSYITCTKGHSGYYSCTKCYEKGTRINDRTCFLNIDNLTLRSDSEFRSKHQPHHHVGTSILESILNIDMIRDVPLDYMHLICLGVVKKLLMLWVYGKPLTKLSYKQISDISTSLLNLVCNIPTEFNRKPRNLNEVKRWKATEFRQFLLYTGPVVLKSIISHDRYINFLSLHIATFILCNPTYKHYINYARSLMQYFVKTFIILYGKDQMSHNVHNLLHICDDVERFGTLDQFSAFKFENYLQSIKKLIRKPEKPLQQIVRRKYELDNNIPLVENTTHCLPTLKKQHHMGPIINNISFLAQYQAIILNNFVLKISEPNNCCSTTDNKIINLKNIISTADGILLIAQEFLVLEDVFNKPCKSSFLGIFAAKNLGPLTLWRLNQVHNKCVKLQYKNIHVIFPLLHSTE